MSFRYELLLLKLGPVVFEASLSRLNKGHLETELRTGIWVHPDVLVEIASQKKLRDVVTHM